MTVSSAIYQDIIDWALAQQRHEASNGQPAPLPQSERRVLLELHQLVKPATPISEPAFGDTDWVSLLNRYRQANPVPSGLVIPFSEKAIEDPITHQKRWAYSVSLDEHSEVFPLGVCQGVPQSFARKKDAKQFAAKSAVQWLMEQKLMPANGKDVAFSRQQGPTTVVPPSPKRQKMSAPPSLPTSTPESATYPRIAPAHGFTSSPAQPVETVTEEQKPLSRSPPLSLREEAPRLVAQLCDAHNIRPPSYKVELEPGQAEFYSGYALFEDVIHPDEIPRQLGHVFNVHGKKLAKEAVAIKVLTELKKLEARRDATYQEVLAAAGLSEEDSDNLSVSD